LGVGDVLENFALEELGEEDRPLGATGGAEPAPLAGKSDENLEAALGTNDAGEAGLEGSAVKIRKTAESQLACQNPYRARIFSCRPLRGA
jgi:hypothetical protein